MFNDSEYYAKVIDNNDPDKAGKVKIRIPHLHAEVSDDMLPWAKQKSVSTGGSSTYGNSSIPEIDSIVWVEFADTENFKKPYYSADVHLNDMHPHGLFEANVKSKITGFASAYPDVKFTYLKNGTCFGVSSGDSPEYFIYHPSGTFHYINKDGDVDIKDKNLNEVKMTSAGIELIGLGATATSDYMVLGQKLKTILTSIINATSGLVTIPAVPGSPLTLNPASILAFTNILSTLDTMLSVQNKTN